MSAHDHAIRALDRHDAVDDFPRGLGRIAVGQAAFRASAGQGRQDGQEQEQIGSYRHVFRRSRYHSRCSVSVPLP